MKINKEETEGIWCQEFIWQHSKAQESRQRAERHSLACSLLQIPQPLTTTGKPRLTPKPPFPSHLDCISPFQQIFMQRQPLYYVVNLILPTCMLYLLDMALLFGPSSHGEKIGFQISLILGISMLAVILNDILPTSSESLPVIGTCF